MVFNKESSKFFINIICLMPDIYFKEINVLFYKQRTGGACIALTNKTIIIGLWNGELKQENNQPQTSGECNKRVQTLAEMLKKSQW